MFNRSTRKIRTIPFPNVELWFNWKICEGLLISLQMNWTGIFRISIIMNKIFKKNPPKQQLSMLKWTSDWSKWQQEKMYHAKYWNSVQCSDSWSPTISVVFYLFLRHLQYHENALSSITHLHCKLLKIELKNRQHFYLTCLQSFCKMYCHGSKSRTKRSMDGCLHQKAKRCKSVAALIFHYKPIQ